MFIHYVKYIFDSSRKKNRAIFEKIHKLSKIMLDQGQYKRENSAREISIGLGTRVGHDFFRMVLARGHDFSDRFCDGVMTFFTHFFISNPDFFRLSLRFLKILATWLATTLGSNRKFLATFYDFAYILPNFVHLSLKSSKNVCNLQATFQAYFGIFDSNLEAQPKNGVAYKKCATKIDFI